LLPVLIVFRSARTALSTFSPTFAAFTPAIALAAGRAFRSGGGGFSRAIGLDGVLSGSVQGGWCVVALWAGRPITAGAAAFAAFIAALAWAGFTGWALGTGGPVAALFALAAFPTTFTSFSTTLVAFTASSAAATIAVSTFAGWLSLIGGAAGCGGGLGGCGSSRCAAAKQAFDPTKKAFFCGGLRGRHRGRLDRCAGWWGHRLGRCHRGWCIGQNAFDDGCLFVGRLL
jgi:hypothetical protein